MPILICLKNPSINLIVEGEIKDDSEKSWDEIFHNQVLMTKTLQGHNVLVPLLQECNIAFMQEVTQEEVDKQKEEAEKRKQGSTITKPQFIFPQGRRGRG